MVSQPNAALGDAPKNPRFKPLSQEIVHLLGQIPLKQKTKPLGKYRCNPPPQMYLPTWQNVNPKKP